MCPACTKTIISEEFCILSKSVLWCEMRSRALAAMSCVCNKWVINQCINALKIGCNEVSMQLSLCDPPEHSARRSTLNTPHLLECIS